MEESYRGGDRGRAMMRERNRRKKLVDQERVEGLMNFKQRMENRLMDESGMDGHSC